MIKYILIHQKLLLFFVFLSGIFIAAIPPSAYAQSFSLSISPPLTHIISKPGNSITIPFSLTNDGDSTVVQIISAPFVPGDQHGNVISVDCRLNKIKSCIALEWLSLGEKQIGVPFFVKGKSFQRFETTIRIPPKTAPGDYFVSLIFSAEAPKNKDDSSTQIIGKIVSNTIISISEDGLIPKQAEFAQLELGGQKISFGPHTFVLVDSFDTPSLKIALTNTSIYSFEAEGAVYLSSPFFPKIRFPLEPSTILSHSTRLLYSSLLPRSFYLGKNTITADFLLTDILGNRAESGKEGKKPTVQASVSFIALPFKLSLSLVIISGSLFWRRRSKHEAKYQQF